MGEYSLQAIYKQIALKQNVSRRRLLVVVVVVVVNVRVEVFFEP